MTTLYDLTAELQSIAAELEEITDADEITPEMGDRLSALLCDASDTHEQWVSKIDNTAALIRDRSMWLDGIDREIARLQELKRIEQNRIDWLKRNLMLAMSVRGTDKLTTPRGKLSICRNGGKQPIALNPLIEPDHLPAKFQRVSIAPDLDAIRSAIENGDPEAESIAQLRERGQHLRIK
jgi:hypothetical protein